MKNFLNKKTKISQLGEDESSLNNLTYIDLALVGINHLPKDGYTIEEMRRRLKVEEKLSEAKSKTFIKLEDAEFGLIYSCSRSVRWNIKHKDIVDYHDYLEKLQKE